MTQTYFIFRFFRLPLANPLIYLHFFFYLHSSLFHRHHTHARYHEFRIQRSPHILRGTTTSRRMPVYVLHGLDLAR